MAVGRCGIPSLVEHADVRRIGWLWSSVSPIGRRPRSGLTSRCRVWAGGGSVAPTRGAPSSAAQVAGGKGHCRPPAERRKATAPTPVRPGTQISRTGPTDALAGSVATTSTDRVAAPTRAYGKGAPAPGAVHSPNGLAPGSAGGLGSLALVAGSALISVRQLGLSALVSSHGFGRLAGGSEVGGPEFRASGGVADRR